ncbi:uncharacterized protein A4U43_C02F12690 [Asparagus officinalis]|uniref:Uncharacterized protein n=1 Tax=Asparagus officinalis TaxID=4686 RepID=A0A5P1FI13_ASPOF|nr:uncharacterized protein A4U43_C02F12690 [Asparagus officinalis]
MDDRVHPADPQPERAEPNAEECDPARPNPNPPKPGTYVIQIPKSQIHRFPPPNKMAPTSSNPTDRRRRSPLAAAPPASAASRTHSSLPLSLLLLLTITAVGPLLRPQPNFPPTPSTDLVWPRPNDNITTEDAAPRSSTLPCPGPQRKQEDRASTAVGATRGRLQGLNLARLLACFQQERGNVTCSGRSLKRFGGSGYRGRMRGRWSRDEGEGRHVAVAVDVKSARQGQGWRG